MAKNANKSSGVEKQKGPIRMDQQYTQAFQSATQRFMQDVENAQMRVKMQTMDFHTPKQ